MLHARKDYNERIQDSAGIIPENEPVFLIRGQDRVGPAAVELWSTLADIEGASDEIVDSARKQAEAMRNWQRNHMGKTPDLPQ